MEALSWACINHDVVESFYNGSVPIIIIALYTYVI